MAVEKNGHLNVVNGVATASRDNGKGDAITDVGSSVIVIPLLQNGVSIKSDGVPFTVGAYKTLNIKATGTAESFVIIFEGAHPDGVYEQIQGVSYKTYKVSGEMTTKNESFQIDVTGYHTFRARIAEIAGGNITVSGKAVS